MEKAGGERTAGEKEKCRGFSVRKDLAQSFWPFIRPPRWTLGETVIQERQSLSGEGPQLTIYPRAAHSQSRKRSKAPFDRQQRSSAAGRSLGGDLYLPLHPAAIEGGLSPDTAYTVGSGCIRNLTACTVLTDVRTISYAMYKDFILRVHRLRRNPSWSAQIKSCAEYTELHLTEDLTIRDRAKRVSYTEYYLSRKFKGSCQSSSFE